MNFIKPRAHSKIRHYVISLAFIGLVVFVANAQPEPPTAFHVISGDGENELAWDPSVSAGVTEYRIYRSTDSVTFNLLTTVPFGTNTYTDTGLTNGQFYFYAVKSFDGTEGEFSTVDASTPEDGFNSFIRFDGSSAYGVVSDSLYLSLDNTNGSQSFSVELWVRVNNTSRPNQTILMREEAYGGGSGKEVYYTIKYSGGQFYAYMYSSNLAVETDPGTLTINENQWYHLTFTRNESTDKYYLYVNGQEVSSGDIFLPNESEYARLFVGGETNSRDDATRTYTMKDYFEGDICELRLWNRFRSEAEVQADLYSRLRGDEDPKLYGVWHFDRKFNSYTYNYGIAELNTSHSPTTPFLPGYENIKLFNTQIVAPEINAIDDDVDVHTNAVNDVLDVQSNDVFTESYTLHSIIVTQPEHGTATVSDKTDILYTPTSGYLGKDSIQYLVVDSTFFSDPHRFSDTAWVNINVYNNPPEITSNGGGDNASVDIDENTTAVTTVTATDADGTSPTFSIQGGDDDSFFSIDGVTGDLTFDSAPDYENPQDDGNDNTYEVLVRASDGTNFDDQTITVTIDNLNDNPPVITSSSTTNVNENATAVMTVTATDADGSSPTFSIQGGDDDSFFSIDGVTGDLTFDSAPDYENPQDDGNDNTYEVLVRASDGTNFDDQTITVTIDNLNDNDPEITSNGGAATATINIDENTNAVDTVTAIDDDIGAILEFSITGGDDETLFNIHEDEGYLAFNTSPDFENPDDSDTDSIYVVEVTVSDGLNTDQQTITITVNDVIETADFEINLIADVDVDENAAYTLAPPPSLSGDTPIGNITYSISGGADAARFTINPATGVVEMSAKNFEDPDDANEDNIYEIEITVEDDDDNSDAESWAVTIDDVAESASFIIDNISDTTVNENAAYTLAPPPSITGTPIGNITYSISGGDDAGNFKIAAPTGVVTMVSRDFESPDDANTDNIYEIEITAEDIDGNQDSESWKVTVNNLNDNNPEITSNGGGDNASINIDENTTAVTTVTATDADGTSLEFSITGGDDQAIFNIDETVGDLVFNTVPDFENPLDDGDNNTYEVIVRASDGTNFDEQAITVSINDLNDNNPEITSNGGGDNASINIDENTTAVTTVTATDADAISNLTFSITGGDDQALFNIDETTGDLAFNTAPDFDNPTDSDTDNTYEVIVSTSDGDFTDEQLLTVIVNEVNSPPVDLSLSQNTVVENEPIGTLVGTFSTDDTGDTHTYTIEGGADAASFSIDGDELVTTESFNFESKDSYEILVRTTDTGGGIFEKTFQVVVLDANDAPSSISLSDNTILENEPIGSLIGVLFTTDEDVDDVHLYTIVGGPDSSLFSIQDNQLLTNGSFDFGSEKNFSVTIRSTDSGGEFIEEDFDIIITVDPERELTIPSVFTPNNDNVNDIWSIPELERYPNCKVVVMHRNGRVVFSSEGYQTAWDGTSKKKVLGEGTYFYIIELNDSLNRVYEGFVMIL